MLDIDETIEAFRRGALEFDCKRIVLSQHKVGGERFDGQGYIRQLPEGTLTFKIYVTQCNAEPFSYLEQQLGYKSGELYGDDAFYDLEAVGRDDTRWTATRILPTPHWDASDHSVLVNAPMQSLSANLNMPQRRHCMRLHFFEEYEVPLHGMSETERHGSPWRVRDRAEFEACGSEFVVRKREGSGETIIETVSDNPFPAAFSSRIQEAIQYITAKTAIWGARLQSEGQRLQPRRGARPQGLNLIRRFRLAQSISVSTVGVCSANIWRTSSLAQAAHTGTPSRITSITPARRRRVLSTLGQLAYLSLLKRWQV